MSTYNWGDVTTKWSEAPTKWRPIAKLVNTTPKTVEFMVDIWNKKNIKIYHKPKKFTVY